MDEIKKKELKELVSERNILFFDKEIFANLSDFVDRGSFVELITGEKYCLKSSIGWGHDAATYLFVTGLSKC